MKHIIDSEAVEKLPRARNDRFLVHIDDLRALLASSPKADDLVKDAERWRHFRETASEEMCYAICGNSNADNEELDQAIDKSMKGN